MERFSALLLGIYILLIAFIDISKSQRSCPPPNFPENANYSFKGQKFQPGDIITYSCLKDYLLVGNEKSKCKYDGDWSNPTPFCDLKADLKNPSVMSDKGFPRTITDITDANENTCYDLKGGEKIEVNLDKKKVLYAVKLFLGPGDASIRISARNSTFEYSNNVERSQWVMFIWNDTVGSTDIMRIQDKSDNKKNTICEIEVYMKEEDGCENPPKQKVVNGYFKVSRSKATLICQEGYNSSVTRLSCEEKKWKSPTFLCEEILCSPASAIRPSNGKWEFRDPIAKISAGTKSYLKCNDNYKQNGGQDVIVCQKDGTWTTSNATCIAGKKSNSQTIIYASVGAVVLLIIISLLGVVIYFVRKQRDKQVVVIYKSTTEGSVISGSDGDSAAPYYETIHNPAPVPPASRPPEILSERYTLPLDAKDTMKKKTMPADIAFSSLKQSALYNY